MASSISRASWSSSQMASPLVGAVARRWMSSLARAQSLLYRGNRSRMSSLIPSIRRCSCSEPLRVAIDPTPGPSRGFTSSLESGSRDLRSEGPQGRKGRSLPGWQEALPERFCLRVHEHGVFETHFSDFASLVKPYRNPAMLVAPIVEAATTHPARAPLDLRRHIVPRRYAQDAHYFRAGHPDPDALRGLSGERGPSALK